MAAVKSADYRDNEKAEFISSTRRTGHCERGFPVDILRATKNPPPPPPRSRCVLYASRNNFTLCIHTKFSRITARAFSPLSPLPPPPRAANYFRRVVFAARTQPVAAKVKTRGGFARPYIKRLIGRRAVSAEMRRQAYIS